ncbi:MAG: hypothetical protein KGM17_07060 [Sphingomonadales bacterium]|nr:hypothetical protein [Sphingomonadales bacterium]
MDVVTNRWWIWLIANAIGIALFFQLAMPTWIEPELASEQGAGAGDGIVWGTTALI